MSDSDESDDGFGYGLPFFFPRPRFPFFMRPFAYGSSSEEEEEEEEEEDSQEDPLILARQVAWGDYQIHLQLRECQRFQRTGYHLEITTHFKLHPSRRFTGVDAVDQIIHDYVPESPPIGKLIAHVGTRPDCSFDDFSEHHRMETAQNFCGYDGTAKKIFHPQLLASKTAIKQGGFVTFHAIEVHPDHEGIGLSLAMMHEALEFLDLASEFDEETRSEIFPDYPDFTPTKDLKWSLVGIRPEYQEWACRCNATNEQKAKSASKRNHDEISPRIKLCRYFARLGFTQAGRNIKDHKDMFMTREMRDAVIGTGSAAAPAGRNPSSPNRPWLSRLDTASLDLYDTSYKLAYSKEQKALLDALDEFFNNQKKANGVLEEAKAHFDRLLSQVELNAKEHTHAATRNHLRKKSPRNKHDAAANIHNSIQEVNDTIIVSLLKNKEDITEKANKELRESRSHFVQKELPSLLKKQGSKAASIINESFSLHHILNHSYTEIDDMLACLQVLVKFGGDVNAPSLTYGETLLHVAIVRRSYNPKMDKVIAYLCAIGADRTTLDGKYQSPLDCVLRDYFGDYAPHAKPFREGLLMRTFETTKLLMSEEEKDSLVDGWLSPRMLHLLEKAAGQMVQRGVENPICHSRHDDHHVPDSLHAHFRLDTLRYTFKRDNFPTAFTKGFLKEWILKFTAVHELLKRRTAPTIGRINKLVAAELLPGYKDLSEQKDVHYRYCESGKEPLTEHVLVTLVDIVKEGVSTGSFVDDADKFERDLASTPLDDLYDLARVMCLNKHVAEHGRG
jgi:hypothetical protein